MWPQRRASARKGRRYGGVMMVWLLFAHLFDPPKAAAIEHLEKQKRIGAEADRLAGTPGAPPDGGEGE